VNTDNAAGARFIFDGISAGRQAVWSYNGTRVLYAGNVVYYSTADGSWHYQTAVFNGASSQLWVDGSVDGSAQDAGSLSLAGVTLGNAGDLGTGYMTGYIAEVVVYDTVLSSGNRALVENYLKSKYGL
jgi:hypothetical protein